jgi:Asp-tRNA(Asn)/Glu-tRNA(Gln) amidotransferase C subunit
MFDCHFSDLLSKTSAEVLSFLQENKQTAQTTSEQLTEVLGYLSEMAQMKTETHNTYVKVEEIDRKLQG